MKKIFSDAMPMFYAGSATQMAQKHTYSGGLQAQTTTPCAVAAVLLRSMVISTTHKACNAPYTTGSVQRLIKHYM
ncbi:hypothetical protein [Comamonas sp. B-9]|uniref:hypothetical protein n=1 Tax=Comamonas sp. B-9 TaxID=1055192 RepID=UPI00130D85C3|nr:hypothetical protein [Comamonas sp. B-9]